MTENQSLTPQKAAVVVRCDEAHYRCGILCCRPKWLQRSRSLKLFLVAICFAGFIQTAFAGYTASQNTTLEKRFALESIIIGTINSSFESGYIIFCLLITHAASKAHVPKCLSLGLISIALGAFIWSLPYFIFKRTSIHIKPETEPICDKLRIMKNELPLLKNSTSLDTTTSSTGYGFLTIVIIAQFCIGAGSSPILTLAPPFIEDHSEPLKAAPLIALLYASSALGTTFGFGLGTLMLQLPEKIIDEDAKYLTPSDREWIGAWWLGFVLLGVIVLFSAFFMGLFPRRLTSYRKRFSMQAKLSTPTSENGRRAPISNEVTSVPKSDGIVVDKPRKRTFYLQGLPQALFKLLRNPVYMVVSLTMVCEMFIVNGFGVFSPKYVETVFQEPRFTVNLVIGCVVLPFGAMGIFCGGLILRRFNFTEKEMSTFTLVVSVIIMLCFISFIFLGCPLSLVAGLTSGFPGENQAGAANTFIGANNPNYVDKCNSRCHCDDRAWKPLCHAASGITFSSPCIAGCTQQSRDEHGKELWTSCSCGGGNESLTSNTSSVMRAGLCVLECETFIPFVVLFTVILFLTGIIQNPLIMVTLRSVGKDERPLALGFQFVIVRILAFVPSGIVFGKVFDSTCLFWRWNGKAHGDCALSDRQRMKDNLTYLVGICKMISLICYGALFLLVRRQSAKSQNVPPNNNSIQMLSLDGPHASNENFNSDTQKRPGHTRKSSLGFDAFIFTTED